MTEVQPEPGWYFDPNGAEGERFWNGSAWTEHRRSRQPAAAASAVAPTVDDYVESAKAPPVTTVSAYPDASGPQAEPAAPPRVEPPVGLPSPTDPTRGPIWSQTKVLAAICLAVALALVIVIVSARDASTEKSGGTDKSTVSQSRLNGLLLSPDQISTSMGTTALTVNRDVTTLLDDSRVTDPRCRALDTVAGQSAYAQSGWTAVWYEEVSGPDTHSYIGEQAVVLFPSASVAESFFAAAAQNWQGCSNTSYRRDDLGVAFDVGQVTNTGGTLSVYDVALDNSRTCQRALRVSQNVAMDISTCVDGGTPLLSDSAVTIAHLIAAKVPTT